MNLALAQPRSRRATIAGLAMAARTADKARAAVAGTLGNFKYDCSMDNKLFAFAGIDASEYLAAVTSSADDSGAEALFVRKSPASPTTKWPPTTGASLSGRQIRTVAAARPVGPPLVMVQVPTQALCSRTLKQRTPATCSRVVTALTDGPSPGYRGSVDDGSTPVSRRSSPRPAGSSRHKPTKASRD